MIPYSIQNPKGSGCIHKLGFANTSGSQFYEVASMSMIPRITLYSYELFFWG